MDNNGRNTSNFNCMGGGSPIGLTVGFYLRDGLPRFGYKWENSSPCIQCSPRDSSSDAGGEPESPNLIDGTKRITVVGGDTATTARETPYEQTPPVNP